MEKQSTILLMNLRNAIATKKKSSLGHKSESKSKFAELFFPQVICFNRQIKLWKYIFRLYILFSYSDISTIFSARLSKYFFLLFQFIGREIGQEKTHKTIRQFSVYHFHYITLIAYLVSFFFLLQHTWHFIDSLSEILNNNFVCLSMFDCNRTHVKILFLNSSYYHKILLGKLF